MTDTPEQPTDEDHGEPMEIHKPKAAHSWREFAVEIGTIICGILIALSLEQGIEWLHWRHQVTEARDAIAIDLKQLVGAAAAQDIHSPCTARRLREIGAALDQAERTHRLPPMGWGGSPPSAGWFLRSMPALMAGQTLAHFPNHEQLALATLSSQLDRLRDRRTAEYEDWSVLSTLPGPGRPISDAEIMADRVVVSRAYRDAVAIRGGARQLETMIVDSGLLGRAELDAAYKDGIFVGPKTPFCAPPPPPPAAIADALERDLLGPPGRPGDTHLANLGLGRSTGGKK